MCIPPLALRALENIWTASGGDGEGMEGGIGGGRGGIEGDREGRGNEGTN